MTKLFPEFVVPEILEQHIKDTNKSFKVSYNFDFVKGDFILDGTGKVVIASKIKTYNDWVVKTLDTERFENYFYSTDEGVEIERIFKMKDRKVIEMELEKTITDAILADKLNRGKFLKNFEFIWLNNELEVLFDIYTDEEVLKIKYSVRFGGE